MIDLDPALRPCFEGAVDLHVHSGPDVLPRKMDDLALARRVAEEGMGGFVLKSHHVPTADRATLVRQLHPGVLAVGSLTLNNFVGGINPQAVEVAALLGARVVWFPTVDAQNEADHLGQVPPEKKPYWASLQEQWLAEGRLRPPIQVLDEAGQVRPEVRTVLEVLRDRDLVLATGHLNPREILAVVREAVALRVRRIVITHVDFPTVNLPLDLQRELAQMGAFLEHCFTTPETGKVTWESVFHAVRQTGPERNVLSTDLGQPRALHPVDGMAAFIRRFAEAGFAVHEIRRMTVENPRSLVE
ncbi:MAG: cytosolic protein [Firmicutes bacterium]|nr:cytosolic protein [Alicyclobacillaceae bacterium]MCL6496711.1 cytosolic protein [Bacillota bacterium]